MENFCFIICHQQQIISGKIKANKTKKISVTTQVFFAKTELQHISPQLLIINPRKNYSLTKSLKKLKKSSTN